MRASYGKRLLQVNSWEHIAVEAVVALTASMVVAQYGMRLFLTR